MSNDKDIINSLVFQEIVYSFGYGLSYTKFTYDCFESEQKESEICVSCAIEYVDAVTCVEVV